MGDAAVRDVDADGDVVFGIDPVRGQQLVPEDVAGLHPVGEDAVRIEFRRYLHAIIAAVVDDVLHRRVTFRINEAVEDLDAVNLPRHDV